MKAILLFLSFLGLAQVTFAQLPGKETDTLALILKSTCNDTTKVDTLNFLSKRAWVTGSSLTKAIAYANQALIIAEKVNFKRGIAAAYNNIGVTYLQQANYPAALKNDSIALKIREDIGDKRLVGYSYINLGNIYLQQANYPLALKSYINALKIGEEMNATDITANAYGSMGNVYSQQGNYPEALKNNLNSLKIRQKSHDGVGMPMAYDNIGDVYTRMGNYNEALKNFNTTLDIEKVDPDERIVSSAYGNIGNVYMLLGKYDAARENYLTALKIENEIGYKYGMADSYINLGKIYSRLGKTTDAKDYLQKGLSLSRENGSRDEIKDAYKELSELDSLAGNITEAYKYYWLYNIMKDSIVNEKSNQQLSLLKVQYESDKKDQQIKTQLLQNRVLQISIYFGIAISLLVIGTILMFFYLQNRRKKKEYNHMLTDLELTVLKAQLNPHFISNSLSAIKSFIEQQPQRAAQYLSKIARLMRRVLEQNEEDMVSLEEELQTVELYMQIEVLRLEYGFDFHFEIDPSVNPKLIMVPPLILQPIVENAIWHGLASKSERGAIIIKAKMEDGLLKFTIEDNGTGQYSPGPKDNVNPFERKSYGLSITRKRIDILSKELKKKGYVTLEYLAGRTVAEIALPVNYH